MVDGAEAESPRVGLVSDNDLNRHTLQNILTEAGYHIEIALDPSNLQKYLQGGTHNQLFELDTWLVDLDESDIQLTLDLLAKHTQAPLLVNDEIPSTQDHQGYEYWSRRLLEKLEVVAVKNSQVDALGQKEILGDSATSYTKHYAKHVWVLAASLGGPDAVKHFLQQLPAGLPVAMVYVQHIENNFDGLLTETIGRDQPYPVHLIQGEQLLLPAEISIVPVDQQLRFLPFGRVVAVNKRWQGQYQPSIDQVVAELAKIYRERLGVIVFSGTCDDGAIGCRVVKACGGTVWAQSPESCVSDAMPLAAIATGCVNQQGTPEQLAQALIDYFKMHEPACKKDTFQESCK